MNKLPKVYANPINKSFNNTQSIYKSMLNNNRSIKKDINYEIDRIFSSKDHIAKSRVRVTLSNEVLEVDIIGKTGSNILTMDNRLIKIKDIVDIEKI